MRSTQVTEWAAGPKLVEMPAPSAPADSSSVQIRVTAAGLHQVVKAQSSGKHYTSGPLPHTPGVDGTGINVSNGKPVYFITLGSGTGSFSEVVNVPITGVTELPEGVDPVQAAALVNPVMSSWMALSQRVDFIKAGTKREWTCLIIGATTMSGKLAIKVARQMGATNVIAAARNEDTLKQLDADSYIVLQESSEETDFGPAANVDVILDYLYGPWLTAYLAGTKTRTEQTYVNIGTVAGPNSDLPGALLRSRNITIRGAGPGAWSLEDMKRSAGGMLGVLKGVHIDEVKNFPIEKLAEGWTASGRVVFTFTEK